MKNLFYPIVLICSVICYGQKNYCQVQHGCSLVTVALEDRQDLDYKNRPCTYFKDLNGSFNKFLGTWVYNQGGHYFKITFFKTENSKDYLSDRQFEDIVQSYYEYRYNGSLIFETYSSDLSFVNSNILYNENLLGFSYQEPSPNSCEKDRIGRLKITYSLDSSGLPILTWDRITVPVTQRPIPCPDGSAPDITDFVVPSNMVLNKI